MHSREQHDLFGRQLEPGEFERLPGHKRRRLENHVIKLWTDAARRPKTTASSSLSSPGQNPAPSDNRGKIGAGLNTHIAANSVSAGGVKSPPLRVTGSPGPGHYTARTFDEFGTPRAGHKDGEMGHHIRYAYMYACMYMYVYLCLVCVCVCVGGHHIWYVHVCMYVCMYVCVYLILVCVWAWACTCILLMKLSRCLYHRYAYIYACMFTQIRHTHTHTHIHTHKPKRRDSLSSVVSGVPTKHTHADIYCMRVLVNTRNNTKKKHSYSTLSVPPT